jgi:predicted nucleic acid-binding protein
MLPGAVPPGPVMVDSDVFSFIHNSRPPGPSFEPFLRGRALLLAFCAVGELRAGAIKAAWGTKRRGELDRAIGLYTVVRPTSAIVDQYAVLHAALHDRLKRGGVNDMWTAACALDLGVPVVTNNLSDFMQIKAVEPGLLVVHPDLP